MNMVNYSEVFECCLRAAVTTKTTAERKDDFGRGQ